MFNFLQLVYGAIFSVDRNKQLVAKKHAKVALQQVVRVDGT